MNDNRTPVKYNMIPTSWWTSDNEPINPCFTTMTKFGQVNIDMVLPHTVHIEGSERWLKWRGQEYEFSSSIILTQRGNERFWTQYNFNLYRRDGGKINQQVFDEFHDLMRQLRETADSLFGEGARKHLEMSSLYGQWRAAKKLADGKMEELAALADQYPAIVRPALRETIYTNRKPEYRFFACDPITVSGPVEQYQKAGEVIATRLVNGEVDAVALCKLLSTQPTKEGKNVFCCDRSRIVAVFRDGEDLTAKYFPPKVGENAGN
jgi:hypothetical protein